MSTASGQRPAITLYPYQQRWLKDTSRFMLGSFARQTGKTFTSALKIAQDIARARVRDESDTWVILSRGQRQSEEAMSAVSAHLQVLQLAAKIEYSDLGLWEGERIRQGLIELSPRCRVIGLPANPDTARGYSANVYLDEFAFHQHSKKIWAAVYPMITRGDKRLMITSTPNGRGNKFYELATADTGQWSVHRATIEDAVADGYPADIESLRQGIRDPDIWASEYMLEFLDSTSSWLAWDEINAAEHADAGKAEKTTPGGACSLGVDIAARNNLWVAFVLEKVGDIWWQRECIAKRRISFAEQFDILAGLHQKYRIVRACYDQTGIGEMPVEEAKRRFGSARSEGVIFTASEKLDLATRLREVFQDRKIRIEGADELRWDLRSLKAEPTATGGRRFIVDGDTDGHADRTWALALALKAATVTPTVYAYRSVPRHITLPRAGEKPLAENPRWVRKRSGKWVV